MTAQHEPAYLSILVARIVSAIRTRVTSNALTDLIPDTTKWIRESFHDQKYYHGSHVGVVYAGDELQGDIVDLDDSKFYFAVECTTHGLNDAVSLLNMRRLIGLVKDAISSDRSLGGTVTDQLPETWCIKTSGLLVDPNGGSNAYRFQMVVTIRVNLLQTQAS